MNHDCPTLMKLNEETFLAEEGGETKVAGKDWEDYLRDVLADGDRFTLRRARLDVANQNAEEMIDRIRKTGKSDARRIVPEEVKAWCDQPLGVIACPVLMPDKQGVLHRYQNVKVFARQSQGDWKCVYWQVTEVNPEAKRPTEGVLLNQYSEVCKSYHAIADFRGKLLALLPIAAGAGISILFGQRSGPPSPLWLMAVGIFGFLATLGLFFYEQRGVQRCRELIRIGAELEKELSLNRGQFKDRPQPLSGFIGAETAGLIIYLTLLAAWLLAAVVGGYLLLK